jgi:replicative DNA helicase
LDEAESAILQLSAQRISRGFMRAEEIVNTSFGSIDGLLQRGQRITGLDEMTSGLQPSDLIILAGRASMGKTALAMNIVENAAIDDQRTVAVFSLEMAKERTPHPGSDYASLKGAHHFMTVSKYIGHQ